jgi:hypothetical protein
MVSHPERAAFFILSSLLLTNSSLNLRQPLPEPLVPREPVTHLATGPADYSSASDAKPRGGLLEREITEAVDQVHRHLPRLIGYASPPGAEGGWGDPVRFRHRGEYRGLRGPHEPAFVPGMVTGHSGHLAANPPPEALPTENGDLAPAGVEALEVWRIVVQDEPVEGPGSCEPGQDFCRLEPGGRLARGEVRPMAAPGVGLWSFDEPRGQRILVNVADHCAQIGLGLDENGPVPAPEQGPIAPVGPIKALGVEPVDMAHDPGEVPLGGSEKEVVVGPQEAVGEHLHAPSGVCLGHALEEPLVIAALTEDPVAGHPPVQDVVDGAGVLYAERAGHGPRLREGKKFVNKRLDPSA